MKIFCKKLWSDFKSPLRVAVGSLLRSRDREREKRRALKLELLLAKRLLVKLHAEIERDKNEILQLKREARQRDRELAMLSQKPVVLPEDPPVGDHGYGPRLVSLAVELAKVAGLRGAARSLKIFFEWLGVAQKLPCWTTIRTWMQRIGIACLQELLEEADDWIWMADHSNQIGPEKVLTVLAVRASKLPPAGQALKPDDVHVLQVQPGTQWKREDMAKVYEELAKEHGAPRAILCDGAVELREGANGLKTKRADLIVLNDFKHKAANFFKSLLEQDPKFKEFLTQLGQTRSAIQQTEMAHLTPPAQKPKARFMNMRATLQWATMALWVLDNPKDRPKEWNVQCERLNAKLGWLRKYAADLAVWSECQEVISRGLKFINEQGLFDGACRQLHSELFAGLRFVESRKLAKRLLHFVGTGERLVKEGERLPMSTEILESSFGLYKQLERQHSKGGFTSLLACFGTLMRTTTPALVKKAFAAVPVKGVEEWVKENLGDTVTSKRHTAYYMCLDAGGATEMVPRG